MNMDFPGSSRRANKTSNDITISVTLLYLVLIKRRISSDFLALQVNAHRNRKKKSNKGMAEEMIGTLEREKTVIKEQQDLMVQRQKTMIGDRIKRIKTARTVDGRDRRQRCVHKLLMDISFHVKDKKPEAIDRDLENYRIYLRKLLKSCPNYQIPAQITKYLPNY